VKRTKIFLLASLLAFFFGSGTHAQEKLGKVTFSTSCNPKVQARFNRAVAMLHSFWFQQGEKAFREVLERDPQCAIATWGIAAILIGNTFAGNATPQDAQKARSDTARALDRRQK